MNYIYLITNKINNKQYIGQTVRTVQERWHQHISQAYRYSDNCYLHNAIRKYGKDNFIITTIEEIENINILDDREIYWIQYYNTYAPNGYNLTLGGNGVRKYDHELIQQRWSEGKSSLEIRQEFNISSSALQNILHKYEDYCQEESIRRSKIPNAIAIGQYDLSDKLIQVFPSIKAAARAMDVTDMAIGRAVKGKNKTSCGYVWKRINS